MFSKSIWLAAFGATLVVTLPSSTHAEPFWNVLGIKRVEADVNKSYRLTKQDGPWLILAATFSGPTADAEARELAFELRRKHKLESYLHKIRFDRSGTVRGRGLNERGTYQRMRYQNGGQQDQIAVLVGHYESTESPELQETLERIKHLHPDCLTKKKGEETSLHFASLRNFQRNFGSNKKKKKGPMGNAFVSRNVLLPKEFFAPGGLDQFVVKMNKGLKYNLLACRGIYTVRVATFRGSVVVDQQKIASIHKGGELKNRLEQAAEDAHNMTIALRKTGVEAYEFHDRYESIVTVGSFDSVGSPRADGKIEIHPAVHRVIKQYGGSTSKFGAVSRKKIAGVRFDIAPAPIQVPRKSIATDYARG